MQHWKKGGHSKFCIPKDKRLPSSNKIDAREAKEGKSDCAICLEIMNSSKKLSCDHEFHASCLAELREFGISWVCPLCRSEIDETVFLDSSTQSKYKFIMGNVCASKEDFNGAEVAYREALQLNPSHSQTHLHLGLILKKKGDLSGAETAFREVLKFECTNFRAHNAIASILSEKGCSVDVPPYHKAVLNCSQLFMKCKSNDFVTSSSLKDSTSQNIFFAEMVTRELQEAGDLAGAEELIRDKIKNHPSDPRLNSRLVDILKAKGDFCEAEELIRGKVVENPCDPDWIVKLADIQESKGELTSAEESCREALKFDPLNLEAFLHLSKLLVKMENAIEAEAIIRDAFLRIERLSRNPRALTIFGDILDARNNPAGAEDAFRKALKMCPHFAISQKIALHERIGEILKKNGNLVGAQAELKMASDLKAKKELVEVKKTNS